MKHTTIDAYHAAQTPENAGICAQLRTAIERCLPEAENRIWHAHPVWFLNGNPIVGYSKLKGCVRLLFWSGQSFDTPGLAPVGKFKAAEMRYASAAQIDAAALSRWLAESRKVQWDYRSIVKRRGRLARLA